MQIEMLYFHSVRKRTGRAGEKLSLHEGADLGELRAELVKRYPVLEGLSKSLLFAVNEEHAPEERILIEDDIVAVMPPFSGG